MTRRDPVQLLERGATPLGELVGVPAADDPDPGSDRPRMSGVADEAQAVSEIVDPFPSCLVIPCQARPHEMDVGVDQSRDHPAALDVDHNRLFAGKRGKVLVGTHSQHTACANRDCLQLVRAAAFAGRDSDLPVQKYEVGRRRCAHDSSITSGSRPFGGRHVIEFRPMRHQHSKWFSSTRSPRSGSPDLRRSSRPRRSVRRSHRSALSSRRG